jgi:hypothetical protein
MDLIVSGSKPPVGLLPEGAVCADLTPLMGDAFATGMLWAVALSAAALKSGPMPQAVTGREAADRPRNALVWTADKAGNAAALVLSRYM